MKITLTSRLTYLKETLLLKSVWGLSIIILNRTISETAGHVTREMLLTKVAGISAINNNGIIIQVAGLFWMIIDTAVFL